MAVERVFLDQGSSLKLVPEHIGRYQFTSQYVSGKSVLDVACGSGYGSAMLKAAGASRVVGVDVSEDVIGYARERHGDEGIDFIVGNAERLALPSGFDVIVSFETIEHLVNPDVFLDQTTRLLAAQGLFIISTPVREKGTLHTAPANPFHLREWSLAEFEALLSRYYPHVHVLGQYCFRKKWFPYSRTLQRYLFKLRYPEILPTIDGFPVLSQLPAYDGFSFAMTRIVAVCRLHDEHGNPRA
jgi:ubiquinone/menaquinone biosynthesis C-methylase UbiE